MIRCILFILSISLGAANADPDLRTALEAVRAQDWDGARAAASRVEDPAARDVVTWALLRARQGNFAETQRFLAQHGDWPGLPLLRARQESNILQGAAPMDVVRYFGSTPPATAQGAMRFAESLSALGETDAARAAIIQAWLSEPMSAEDHAEYMERFGTLIAPHHAARLNTLVWEGHASSAGLMLPLVSEADAALARARLALRAEENGVDALIEAVPASLRNHPGLLFERFRWRAAKGRTDGALEILLPASRTKEGLGRPDIWEGRREGLARGLMREGRGQEAYRVAANHHVDDISEVASLEWLAGYIALRKLGDPQTAIGHFKRFKANVGTPISFGRAGYWLGRAYEAAGDKAMATESYGFAARYQTSFYGQLAAERGGFAPDPMLTGAESFPDWRSAAFTNSTVLRAALVLQAAGEAWLTERFMTHLAESLSRTEIGQLIDLAIEMGEPHIAVMIGKRAATMGMELYKGYYAIMPELVNMATPVAPELVLSIARRESEFDPVVISHAGARGLLQLMPRTAQAMAEKVGEAYSSDRLLADPLYNARLGAAYLAQLEQQFGKSIVLVPAAYNAGPSRAIRWVEELGDPTDPRVDVVDWIEHVPFTETRNYIMRVSESMAIYRARLTGRTQALDLTKSLRSK